MRSSAALARVTASARVTQRGTFRPVARLAPSLSCNGARAPRLDATQLLAVEELLELLAPLRVAQLGQRLGFDLADALPGDAELLADLFERAGLAVDQPEPQLHDLLLPVRQLAESLLDRLGQHAAGGHLGRGVGTGVLYEVGEVGVVLLHQRRVERQQVQGNAR